MGKALSATRRLAPRGVRHLPSFWQSPRSALQNLEIEKSSPQEERLFAMILAGGTHPAQKPAPSTPLQGKFSFQGTTFSITFHWMRLFYLQLRSFAYGASFLLRVGNYQKTSENIPSCIWHETFQERASFKALYQKRYLPAVGFIVLGMRLFYLQLRSFYFRFVCFTYGGGTVSNKNQTQFPDGGNHKQNRSNPVSTISKKTKPIDCKQQRQTISKKYLTVSVKKTYPFH